MNLQDLNKPQKQAVTTIEGPLLVVAGPGTGKTLTIVHRIAYLIQKGVKPENILAVTFTNRAAREMRERIDSLLGKTSDNIFIGTFHLLGLKIIRDNISDNFVIYNRDEQTNLLKELLKGSDMKFQQAADRISRIKNFLEDMDDGIKGVYEEYQSALTKNTALDFDDLILKPIEILSKGESSERYRNRFRYIMVDEYQDINPAQYKLLKLMSHGKDNICAIGDSDQAIYAFRGADVSNFLNFEMDFKDAMTITLTENYRSTAVILNASDNLIRNNLKRIDKELKATRENGVQITVISVPDEKAEGETIVREIEQRMGGTSHYQLYAKVTNYTLRNPLEENYNSYKFSDFAVIFRTNAQAKAIEEAFLATGIPYQIIGRQSLRQVKEIEDTISYLKTLINPAEMTDTDHTDSTETSLLTPPDFFDPRADAVTLMTLHMAKGLEFKVVFIAGVEDGIIPYTIKKEKINPPIPPLTKGGEGGFTNKNVDIEEERRLFYVGITRSKDELFLIHARNRFLYGQRLIQSPSLFLAEIPEEFIEYKFIPDRIKKDNQIGLF